MINEGGFWRHLVITNLVPPTTVPRHRLDENERLLAPVARAYRRKYLPLLKSVAPTAPLPDDAGTWTSDGPYAVLHLCGKYSDKDVSQMVWHRLAQHLTSKGLRLAFTGGGGEVEENGLRTSCVFYPKALIETSRARFRSDRRRNCFDARRFMSASTRRRPTSRPQWERPFLLSSDLLRPVIGGSAPSAGSRNFASHVSLPRSKTVTILKNPDYADCRQCRPGHKTRCPRSSDTSLALCLQTMPPVVVLAEVDRILAGRADASLPVSARTPDLSTKPDCKDHRASSRNGSNCSMQTV